MRSKRSAAALEADVQVRKRDRDDVDATSRAARDCATPRMRLPTPSGCSGSTATALDRLTAEFRAGKATVEVIGKARADKAAAETALAAADGCPRQPQGRSPTRRLPTSAESALAAARAERSALAALLEKSRIRAPLTGVVLRLEAKVGEIVAPSPELALAVIGDTAHLRVRTEVDERDAGKVRIGQFADDYLRQLRRQNLQGQDRPHLAVVVRRRGSARAAC